jgi:hypothetical protein
LAASPARYVFTSLSACLSLELRSELQGIQADEPLLSALLSGAEAKVFFASSGRWIRTTDLQGNTASRFIPGVPGRRTSPLNKSYHPRPESQPRSAQFMPLFQACPGFDLRCLGHAPECRQTFAFIDTFV